MEFKEFCNFTAGLIGGMLTVLVGHPFDTVKTNLQTGRQPIKETCSLIYQAHGLRGYFRGLTFPLITSGITNSLFFGSYETVLNSITANQSSIHKPPDYILRLCRLNQDAEVPLYSSRRGTYTQIFCAGAIAGIIQTPACVPSEVLKIHLQNVAESDKALRNSSDIAAIRYFLRNNGFKALFSGMSSMFIREAFGCGIYMYIYVASNDFLDAHNFRLGRRSGVIEQFIAGGTAGILSWWGVLPFDVIKSKIQADDIKNPRYSGMWDCAKDIYKVHGFRGFTRGFIPLTIRAFPVNGFAFIAYESFVTACRKRYMGPVVEEIPENEEKQSKTKPS